jgi:hypothetical protein
MTPRRDDLDPAIEAELVHLIDDGEPCGQCFDDVPPDDEDLVVLIDEPTPLSPVKVKCHLCGGPLTVWQGEVICCTCTTWELPDRGGCDDED